MLRDAGIPAAVLMTKALQCDAVKVTRALLLDGVALDPVPTAEILQHEPQLPRERRCLSLFAVGLKTWPWPRLRWRGVVPP